ncbi:hypothetical protein FDUTEX481_07735 [Tolypothrix sp. PCC 7601]|nr:hypothetical protein FDUTEX481_07735 [Tolypothrix sp. PCC 7601]
MRIRKQPDVKDFQSTIWITGVQGTAKQYFSFFPCSLPLCLLQEFPTPLA